MTELPKIHTHTVTLSAALCNAQMEISPAMLIQHIIETATEHADRLGVGFKRLSQGGNLWVLSRLAIEMTRYPRVLETFAIHTWIESFNRHFSQRNFEITVDGTPIGYARTIWVAIDMQTRRPADIGSLADIAPTVIEKECPILPPSKLRSLPEPTIVKDYTFQVSDIDFNRHVNSARYVELFLNQFDLQTFDENYLSRFDIVFQHEAHFGNQARVSSTPSGGGSLTSSINVDGRDVCLSRSTLTARSTKQ